MTCIIERLLTYLLIPPLCMGLGALPTRIPPHALPSILSLFRLRLSSILVVFLFSVSCTFCFSLQKPGASLCLPTPAKAADCTDAFAALFQVSNTRTQFSSHQLTNHSHLIPCEVIGCSNVSHCTWQIGSTQCIPSLMFNECAL